MLELMIRTKVCHRVKVIYKVNAKESEPTER